MWPFYAISHDVAGCMPFLICLCMQNLNQLCSGYVKTESTSVHWPYRPGIRLHTSVYMYDETELASNSVHRPPPSDTHAVAEILKRNVHPGNDGAASTRAKPGNPEPCAGAKGYSTRCPSLDHPTDPSQPWQTAGR